MAATLTDPLIGHLVDGRYEVLSRVARGGMATVYLAVDRRLDREVALKVMHPHLAEGASGADFQARFRREARAAARLTHPGLVGVLDQGVDGETSYLAMEYVDGSNLRRRLTEDGPLSLDDALRTTEAVLEALSVAHRAGLVHRDIKPENVLIARDGRVKVADFGLARAVTEVTSTTTGTVLGTVAYLSPELVARGTSDARTDVYAVGILLFEMLTGTQPYTGATPIQVAYQHVHSDIPAPSERVSWLPTELDELVEALAAREPDERPADAAAALSLVRRTRAALDDELLARRADPPAVPVPDGTAVGDTPDGADGAAGATAGHDGPPPHDPDATALLGLSRPPAPPAGDGELRRTMALKIGAGLDDPAAQVGPPPPPPADARPRRRRRGLVVIAVLALLAVLGFGTWWFLQGPGAYTTVPEGLVNATQAEAEAILADAGLEAAVTSDYHPSVPEGSVFATDPAAGEQVRRDGTVTLVVSLGPDMREIPADLLGKPFADVKAALEQAGFAVPEPTQAWHDTVPNDAVISLTGPDGAAIEGGASLPKDTPIAVLVSKGPEPITVPSVLGEERQRAIAILETNFGLVVTVREDFSEEYPAGTVAAQSLAPEADAHRRDPIEIVISTGPPLVPVPDVVNRSVDEAKTILRDAGFEVDVNQQWPWDNRVVDQDPDKDTPLPKGSTVTIFVR